MYKEQNKFSTSLDLVVTPLVMIIIFLLPLIPLYFVNRLYRFDSFLLFLIYFFTMISLSLLILKIIRIFFPIRPGIYSYDRDRMKVYIFNLYSFILIFPLYLVGTGIIVPPPLRKCLYKIMGCQFGKGIIPIGGNIMDPHLTTIGRDTMIGAGSMILAHAILSTKHVVLGRVIIGNSVTIGAKAVILPGVSIGDYSMINAASVVSMNTKIPAKEIWGGSPAVKIGDVELGF